MCFVVVDSNMINFPFSFLYLSNPGIASLNEPLHSKHNILKLSAKFHFLGL